VELGHESRSQRYCAICQATRCPECRRVAARGHRARCRYLTRRRRPPRIRYGVTTEAHVVRLFDAYRAVAIRFARYIARLPDADAEDIVADVFLWIWAHRDTFATPPDRTYLFRAVQHGAWRSRQYFWPRRVVALDPAALGRAGPAESDELPSGLLDPGTRWLAEQAWRAEPATDDPTRAPTADTLTPAV
jgi:hypothetical protein